MSHIHYFQRYSQSENVATNNSLLLLSRLYQYSPNKFNLFLDDLLDAPLGAGIFFSQQEKSEASVPDGLIYQSSFRIAIETKLHKNFSINQLSNHLDSFSNEETKILLSLSPTKISSEKQKEVRKAIKAKGSSIKFFPTTFKAIIHSFRNTISDYEFELNEIIDDYESYCMESSLIKDIENKMRAVTCGWTLEENFEFNLYYAGKERSYSDHTYLGAYSQKAIRGIGKISNIITADLDGDKLIIHDATSGSVSDKQRENIIKIIPVAFENNGWDISKDHKFFCVDELYETNFEKISKYPLQGTKFFNLKDVLNVQVLPSTKEIALLLNSKTW